MGGSYWCLNMLQGSPYFPDLNDAVLFLEHPAEGKATLMNLDSGLRALSFQDSFQNVRGIVLGRFARGGEVTRENVSDLLRGIARLKHLPVIANCDFGHTTPMLTLPIGGRCRLESNHDGASIWFLTH